MRLSSRREARLHPPRKAHGKGHIESFNGRLRDECLNVEQFWTIDDAKRKIDAWRDDYNYCRPHSSLGHLTPSEFIAQGQTSGMTEALTFVNRDTTNYDSR
jgi:putative transposase